MHRVQPNWVRLGRSPGGGQGDLTEKKQRPQVGSFLKECAHHCPWRPVSSQRGNEVEQARLGQKVDVKFVSYVILHLSLSLLLLMNNILLHRTSPTSRNYNWPKGIGVLVKFASILSQWTTATAILPLSNGFPRLQRFLNLIFFIQMFGLCIAGTLKVHPDVWTCFHFLLQQ
jgi:hypothetical protein